MVRWWWWGNVICLQLLILLHVYHYYRCINWLQMQNNRSDDIIRKHMFAFVRVGLRTFSVNYTYSKNRGFIDDRISVRHITNRSRMSTLQRVICWRRRGCVISSDFIIRSAGNTCERTGRNLIGEVVGMNEWLHQTNIITSGYENRRISRPNGVLRNNPEHCNSAIDTNLNANLR